MKRQTPSTPIVRHLISIALCTGLTMPLPLLAGSVILATSPLATSTTSTVQPNLLLVLDNSGSMDWDHMPDDASDAGSAVTFSYGYYGLRSSQCNQVYYNPAVTYQPPVYADKTTYPNASFTAALPNGYKAATSGGSNDPDNLNSEFKASQSLSGDSSGQSAYYFSYSGSQTTTLQKNYNSTSNTFYNECHSAKNASPGNAVFSKQRLATTETTTITVSGSSSTAVTSITVNGVQLMSASSASSSNSNTVASNIASKITLGGFSATASGSTVTITGPASAANYTPVITCSSCGMTLTPDVFPDTTAANLTNFANWYSYYRTRMMMMKTATGRAFSSLDNKYRVGLMKISASSTPTIEIGTFADWTSSDAAATAHPNDTATSSTKRSDWYSALYNMAASGSTPLRTALSDAGRYYAGKLSATDPVKYSCQQNFAILSTDGYWNSGNGYQMNGSTAVGNQDGIYGRPYYDGANLISTAVSTWNSLSTTVKRTTQPKVDTTKTYVATTTNHLDTVKNQYAYSGLTLNSVSDATHGAAKANSAITRPSSGCAPNCTSTITTTTAHGLAVGDTVTISGVATSGYNGTYRVSAVGSTTKFSVVLPARPSTASGAKGTSVEETWANGCSIGQGKYSIQAQHFDNYTNKTSTVTTTTTKTDSIQTDTTTVVSTPKTRTVITSNGVVTSDNTVSGSATTTNTPVVTTIVGTPVTATSAAAITTQANTQGAVSDYGAATTSACSAALPAPNPSAATTFSTYPASPAGDIVVVGAETATPGYPTLGVLGATSGSSTISGPTVTSTAVSTTTTPSADCVTGTCNNLADIAMYYYQTDLRTSANVNCTGALGSGIDVCENNVFISGTDNQTQQHMTSFTLGLGASGWMNYSPSYNTDTTGDYQAVKLGSAANSAASPPVCSWQANGTTCNWPVPGMDGSSNGYIANIDDLWHAAINGRGAYFSATDPQSLSDGLSNALAGINARKGSAAAAATSTLNPVAGNNYAYVASYTTVKWQGNLEARGINVSTGIVNENASWCVENVTAGTCAAPASIYVDTSGATTAYYCVTPNSVTCSAGTLVGSDCRVPLAIACTGTMNAIVAAASDTRTIKTANSSGTALIDFNAAYATANPSFFNAARISTLSQWSSLTAAQQTAAQGVNLVNYLRGQNGYEDRTANTASNRLYRAREAVLGDALESQPSFIGKPVFSYAYAGYGDYVTAQASRVGTVFMGANDGMMHAFDADSGAERWAYVPSMIIPNMWRLADNLYESQHVNLVNGSPITSDIYCPANCGGPGGPASWRTILVAGLNGGGRGYYALDITVPSSPTLLWEFTTTSGIGSAKDDDLGYGFGQPIITRKQDGTWVIMLTSGYNNTSPGDGKSYLYVLNANTGAIISKIGTGIGSTATPSGLARISGWNDDPGGNQVGYVYGGDLLGNLWRFDINSPTAATIGTGAALKFATLFSDVAGASPQPITTAPVLGKIVDKRVVFIGTGKYLETGDLTTTQQQTQYALKDDDSGITLVNPRNTLVNQTLSNNPDGTATRIGSSNTVDFYTGRGWYVDFPESRERVNIEAKLVQGTLLVPTIVPSSTVCAPGGHGWLNFIDYQTGGAVDQSNNLAGKKYDSPIVGINVLYIAGDPVVEVVTSNNPTPTKDPDVVISSSAAGFSGKRVIWRELIP